MLGPQACEPGQPVHARHVEVEQHGVGVGLPVERGLRLGQRARHAELRAGKRLAERRRQGVAHHRVIVGNEKTLAIGHGSRVAIVIAGIKPLVRAGGCSRFAARSRRSW
jgi:hypothetical protein